jgi:ligand-binding sensor domain-containing protein/two-component sensor histidine kinase
VFYLTTAVIISKNFDGTIQKYLVDLPESDPKTKTRLRNTLLTCFLLFVSLVSNAQYPHHFSYDNENGLPSNEIYSIVTDRSGFIWIGCGAGLYKFDGIRYTPYLSVFQKSRSLSGLTISSSQTLYCFNFRSQTFYVSGDSLKELPNPGLLDIINMTADTKGNIYVSHLDGVSCYNEKEQKWTLLFQPGMTSPLDKNRPVCKASRITTKEELYFVCPEGIGHLSNKNTKLYRNTFFHTASARKLDLVEYRDTLWVFAKENNYIYQYANGTMQTAPSKKLHEALYNRKITNTRVLSDSTLWICTYKGMIRYDAANDSVDLFYPEIAFSDCILDREGNYWFGTMQDGLLRVSDLRYKVWNKEYSHLPNDRLSKITTDNKHIYTTSSNGLLYQLRLSDYTLQTHHTGRNADIQSLDYDFNEQTLWFNHNNDMFGLKEGVLSSRQNNIQAVKARHKAGQSIFQASSHGTFINDQLVNNFWARVILKEPKSTCIWVATNNGVLKFIPEQQHWHISDTLLKDRQILSIDQDSIRQKIYALSFDGILYQISKDNKTRTIGQLPQGILANKLKYYKDHLYHVTNKGLWIYNLHTLQWQQQNMLSGIVSDNILDITIVNETVWLATGKGLQKIPSTEQPIKAQALIYLKKAEADNAVISISQPVKLTYGQIFVLYPETAIFTCEGDFKYAYRIKNIDTAWVELPGNIEKIEIRNTPSGAFEIELKAIDCFNRNSANTITIKGYISPPFWKTWWFAMLIGICLSIVGFWFFKARIKQLQVKQLKEIERINLENELRMAQQRALIAQMNPHFIFNVLNSIKSYMYRNDRDNAIAYLDDFSHLVRTVLEMSDIQYSTLQHELTLLKLYIELETMMMADDFSYTIELENNDELAHLQFPSLLLQPFIENAFKHGLRTKKGNKQLTIGITSGAKDTINIEITDNGIGRQQAEELNRQNIFKRSSFATSAIEHRINLINKEGVYHITIETIDLYHTDNTAAGTRILVTVQYNH